MSAYLIVDELSVENPEQLNEYISRAGPLITRAGGNLLRRGTRSPRGEGHQNGLSWQGFHNGEVKRMVEL